MNGIDRHCQFFESLEAALQAYPAGCLVVAGMATDAAMRLCPACEHYQGGGGGSWRQEAEGRPE
jgi:hypothetical protein